MSDDLVIQVDEKYRAGAGKDEQRQILGRCYFDVNPGELFVVLGESGCGKSTLLRMILALDREYVGVIKSGNIAVNAHLPKRGMVFQEPRLLPWFTVVQNVEFGMTGDDSGQARRKRALSMLKLVGLLGFEDHLPRELSGGMAQRTALARALVNMPEILLLDEPFAALDLHTRFRLQDELLRILEQAKTTTVLVTHDIDEALYLADRILVMTKQPGSVRSIHGVSESKPRQRNSPALMELRARLLEELVGD